MTFGLRAEVVALFAASALAVAACADDGIITAPGKHVSVQVAPLQLVGITDACYDIQVHNAPGGGGDVVWHFGDPNNGPGATTVALAHAEDSVCAGRYGYGPEGGVTFVGTCDASGAPPSTNTVTVWIENIYGPGGAQIDPSEWDNPCPPGTAGCSLEFPCTENTDTEVPFNLVVMRDANQGFFDVAVTFEDIFCSAKLDCSTASGPGGSLVPINLLFNGAGLRDHTAVIGFACTAGPNVDDNTTLHMSDVRVNCSGGTGSGNGTQGARGYFETSIEAQHCLDDGTLMAINFGPPDTGNKIRGVRYVPNANALSGYDAQLMAPPPAVGVPGYTTTGPLGAAATGLPMEQQGFTAAGEPRATVVVGWDPTGGSGGGGGGGGPPIGGATVGLVHFPDPTGGSTVRPMVYDAVLKLPASVPMVIEQSITEHGSSHYLVASSGIGDSSIGVLVRWDIAAWLNGDPLVDGFGNDIPALTGVRLQEVTERDAGGQPNPQGNCHVSLADYGMACGVCASGGGYVNACWKLDQTTTMGSGPTAETVVPVLNVGTALPTISGSTVAKGVKGDIIAMPAENVVLAVNDYFVNGGTTPFWTATIATYSTGTGTWTAHHLAYTGQPSPGAAWDDQLYWERNGYLLGYLDFDGAQRRTVLLHPSGSDWTAAMDTWSQTSVGATVGDFESVRGTVAIGTKTFIYGSSSQYFTSGSSPYLGEIPATPDTPIPLTFPSKPPNYDPNGFSYWTDVDWYERATPDGNVFGLSSTYQSPSGLTGVMFWNFGLNVSNELVFGSPTTMYPADLRPVGPERMSYNIKRGLFGMENASGPGFTGEGFGTDQSYQSRMPLCADRYIERRESVQGQGHNNYVFDLTASTPDGIQVAHPLPPLAGLESSPLLPMAWQNLPMTMAGNLVFTAAMGLGTNGKFVMEGVMYDLAGAAAPTVLSGIGWGDGGMPEMVFANGATNHYWALGNAVIENGPDYDPISESRLALFDINAGAGASQRLTELESTPAPGAVKTSFLYLVDPGTGAALTGDLRQDQSKGMLDMFGRPVRWMINRLASGATWTVVGGTTGTPTITFAPASSGATYPASGVAMLLAPAHMGCRIFDMQDGLAIGGCVGTLASAPQAAGLYVWPYGTDTTGDVEPVELPTPTPSDLALDPNTGDGLPPDPRYMIGYDGAFDSFVLLGTNGGAVLANYSFIDASYPTDPFGRPWIQTAVVMWTYASGTWTPHVEAKGIGGAGIKYVDRYVVGYMRLSDSDTAAQTILAQQPSDGNFDPDMSTWNYWITVQINGTTANVNLRTVLPGENIVLGTAQLETSPGSGSWLDLPIAAPIVVTNMSGPLQSDPLQGFQLGSVTGTQTYDRTMAMYRASFAGDAVSTIREGSQGVAIRRFDVDAGQTFNPSTDTHTVTVSSPGPDWSVEEIRIEDIFGSHGAGLAPFSAVRNQNYGIAEIRLKSFGISETHAAYWPLGGGELTYLQMPSNLIDPFAGPSGPSGAGYVLPLDVGPGNVWQPPHENEGLFQYAISRGAEQLNCNGISCAKRYFNIALGFDPDANCTVHFDATADDGSLFVGGNAPYDTRYPVIHYDVPLSYTDGTGTHVCGPNPLNGVGSGVQVGYIGLGVSDPGTFCYEYGPGSPNVTDFCNGGYSYNDGP